MDIRQTVLDLTAKHAEEYAPLDFLQILRTSVDLELSTVRLHERMQQDVYELFGKNDYGDLSKEGKRLQTMSRVTRYHSAQTLLQWIQEATVQFSCSDIDSNLLATQGVASDKISTLKKHKKRKITYPASDTITAATATVHENANSHSSNCCNGLDDANGLKVVSNVAAEENVYVHYFYEETQVNSLEDRMERIHSDNVSCDDGATEQQPKSLSVSVLERPCKKINFTISIGRGEAGIHNTLLLDFQLLTAGNSPATRQVLLRQPMALDDGDDEDDDARDDENSDSDDVGIGNEREEEEEEDKQNGEDEDENHVDFYTIELIPKAVHKFVEWTRFSGLGTIVGKTSDNDNDDVSNDENADVGRCGGDGGCAADTGDRGGSDDDSSAGGSGVARIEGDLAQRAFLFLLSAPFADDAWGMHELILDQVMAANDVE